MSKDALDNAINAAEGRAGEPRRRHAPVRADQGGRLGLRRHATRSGRHEALVEGRTPRRARCSRSTRIKAPTDGVVLSINATVGSYVSPQGAYDTYTQGFGPVVVMGTSKGTSACAATSTRSSSRGCRRADKMQAQMFIRGTSTKIPLEFVRVQPYVSPKIQLSNQRQEKVDLRVLPVIFRFAPPAGRRRSIPGELVDVYVGEK